MTTNSSPLQTIHPSQRRILWWNKKEVPAEQPRPRCDYLLPISPWRAGGGAAFLAPFDLRKPVFEWVNSLMILMLRIQWVLDCLAEAKVLIPNIKEVRDYLFRHKDIVDLTRRACRRTKEVFESEPGAQLVLELERDPEFNCEHLNILVRLQTYDESIWERIEKVSVEFEYEMAGKSSWILITTDYRRPQ